MEMPKKAGWGMEGVEKNDPPHPPWAANLSSIIVLEVGTACYRYKNTLRIVSEVFFTT